MWPACLQQSSFHSQRSCCRSKTSGIAATTSRKATVSSWCRTGRLPAAVLSVARIAARWPVWRVSAERSRLALPDAGRLGQLDARAQVAELAPFRIGFYRQFLRLTWTNCLGRVARQGPGAGTTFPSGTARHARDSYRPHAPVGRARPACRARPGNRSCSRRRRLACAGADLECPA